MHKLFDQTTKKIKKKAEKAMDLLRPPSGQSRSASPAPFQQAEDPASISVESESQKAEPTATAAVTQLASASVSVAADSSQHTGSHKTPLKTFPLEILAQGATDFPLVFSNLKLNYYLVNPEPVIFMYSSGYYLVNTARVVAWYLSG